MRVLILHPADSLEAGVWAESRWDLVLDLGWSGRFYYAQASGGNFHRVISLCDLLGADEHGAQIRSLHSVGLGELTDSEGLDWWELFSPFPYSRLDEILMLLAARQQIGGSDEVVATRPHGLVQVLSRLLRKEIKCLRTAEQARASTMLQHYARLVRTFGPAQLTEIALDKWDSDFRLRRFLSQRKKASREEVVLLPSAYGNVSRSQSAYARLLPDKNFLQVVTRRNARIGALRDNIEVCSLASYAPVPYRKATEKECAELRSKWDSVLDKISNEREELRLARELGVFAGFPSFLRNGLRVRDAWLDVLRTEPVRSVLSADENNPYTRIPVLLASSRGIPTVFCDHGALNMGFAVRPPCSDTYLVRGEMARDYMVRQCGVDSRLVEVGAAGKEFHVAASGKARDRIVVFSEAYELFAGRVEGFYGEIFPRLCSLARETGRRVVLKLHPFESLRNRRAVLKRVLSKADFESVEIIGGPLGPELMERTWCGITVESSVACDCAVQGVVCFLCHWFEATWYGYGRQFAKFGAGYLLKSPEDIPRIPSLLEQFEIPPATRDGLMTAIGRERLEQILFRGKAVCGSR